MQVSRMDKSPSISAARHFLTLVWDTDTPNDQALLAALDRLVAAYPQTPDVGPTDTDLEAPRSDGPLLYKELAARFPDYGLYPVSDPTGSPESAASMGDAIDDLADLTKDMREVVWYADNVGLDDAHWSFRLHHFHWARHARELSLYLFFRLYW
jgi:hypothetical protein